MTAREWKLFYEITCTPGNTFIRSFPTCFEPESIIQRCVCKRGRCGHPSDRSHLRSLHYVKQQRTKRSSVTSGLGTFYDFRGSAKFSESEWQPESENYSTRSFAHLEIVLLERVQHVLNRRASSNDSCGSAGDAVTHQIDHYLRSLHNVIQQRAKRSSVTSGLGTFCDFRGSVKFQNRNGNPRVKNIPRGRLHTWK